MTERIAVKEGRLKKHIIEIMLTPEQDEQYNAVVEKLSTKSGFKPLKWQSSTMIFLEGVKSIDRKMP